MLHSALPSRKTILAKPLVAVMRASVRVQKTLVATLGAGHDPMSGSVLQIELNGHHAPNQSKLVLLLAI